ncbi:hypothetical protein [Streptomyces sp. NRRL S-448]|uniref:hypothetical protein n=1 Tax=Streptomyces sp. NRRL S-448 TaxID=1463907 RepID=UPI0035694EDB
MELPDDGRALSRQERLLQSTDFDPATGAAAAQLAVGEPDPAYALKRLELELELERGVLWSRKLDVYTDLKLIQEVCPERADRVRTSVRVLMEPARGPSACTGRSRRLPMP